jgi:alkanesulfonate monooxygenase SsuD/methylene tetrahydromethanopterin reductase-like flavin-dependent oxidoreductase (luciferase family)
MDVKPYHPWMPALAPPPPPPPPPPIVAPCPAEARELHRAAQCGFVTVPLDRTRPDGKTIRVYFERYPRRNRNVPRVSTVVSLEGGRRLAAAAALTAADVVARWLVNYDGAGVGLRGGRWTYAGYPNVRFRLTNVQLVPGVRVSGTVRWAYRGGAISGTLELRGPGGTAGTLAIAYPKQRGATATLTGTVGGRELRATMPAP